MIDTHSHLYSEEFKEDIEDILQKSNAAGVSRVYLPAIDSNSHEMMLALADKHPGYCIPMMGLHPCYVDDRFEAELDIVKEWLGKRPFAATLLNPPIRPAVPVATVPTTGPAK
jgi:TatD DNase family protein